MGPFGIHFGRRLNTIQRLRFFQTIDIWNRGSTSYLNDYSLGLDICSVCRIYKKYTGPFRLVPQLQQCGKPLGAPLSSFLVCSAESAGLDTSLKVRSSKYQETNQENDNPGIANMVLHTTVEDRARPSSYTPLERLAVKQTQPAEDNRRLYLQEPHADQDSLRRAHVLAPLLQINGFTASVAYLSHLLEVAAMERISRFIVSLSSGLSSARTTGDPDDPASSPTSLGKSPPS